jgi:hypothetical protein
MTTLTRATLGKLAQRATKNIDICGHAVRIQKPTPLEFTQYQLGLLGKDGTADIAKFPDAILLLTARMWIDGDGQRLFTDSETKLLGEMDLDFYQQLSAECQRFARGGTDEVLGESEQMPGSDLLAESV